MAKVMAILAAILAASPVVADPMLLMAEEEGCMWCARWNKEIAPIYDKTAEGRAAPLSRFDINGDIPDVEFAKRVHFTPTFILVEDGKEIDRIEGYPGEDFFWGLLAAMLERGGIALEQVN